MERNFPNLNLTESGEPESTMIVVNSPKTPTLTRKAKAISLDSEPEPSNRTDSPPRSMPNTPRRKLDKKKTLTSSASDFGSNLTRFGSNSSIAGSQTLKTLPEVMTLQDFTQKTETTSEKPKSKTKSKGLLERRGSNASLTIDLSSSSSVEVKSNPPIAVRLNLTRSVNNLNLTTFGNNHNHNNNNNEDFIKKASSSIDRRKSQSLIEKCDDCTIYESVPNEASGSAPSGSPGKGRCRLCARSARRKSLSNENLYVPPCNSCHRDEARRGQRRACYPQQAHLDAAQALSEDFKFYLQNVQYLQTAGNPLGIDELRLACEPHRVPKIHQEFWEVPLNLQEKCLVSGSQTRNRYRGVLPNEHSRVILTGGQQSYIHANYIKGPDYTENAYIATQGPMAHTCEDFWQMAWNSKSTCIVMLTDLAERGRPKCEPYFPLGKHRTTTSSSSLRKRQPPDRFTFDGNPSNDLDRSIPYDDTEPIRFEETDEVTFGKFRIELIGPIRKIGSDCCSIRGLKLTRSGSAAQRFLRHFWFAEWRDHRMADPERVLAVASEVAAIAESPDAGFPIVHCSAGIGRTGCFLAILNGIRQIRNQRVVDVLAILCSLRLHRGGAVQTAEQYELVYRVLKLYADSEELAG